LTLTADKNLTNTGKIKDLQSQVELLRILIIEGKREHDVRSESKWTSVINEYSELKEKIKELQKFRCNVNIGEEIESKLKNMPCNRNWRVIISLRNSMYTFYFFLVILYILLFNHTERVHIKDVEGLEKYYQMESQPVGD